MIKNSFVFFLLVAFCAISVEAKGLGWLKDWSLKGDFRLRYEGIWFDDDSRKDRHRGRFRMRLGGSKKIDDKLKFRFRFATFGGGATSTNQSFDDSFGGKDFMIDRAYLEYRSRGWALTGGKMKNPFHHTNMVWDRDVNPEGGVATYQRSAFFASLAFFPLEEESSGADLNLAVAQFGLKSSKRLWKLSGAYYHYSRDSEKFAFVDALATLRLKTGAIPHSITLNVARNTSNDFRPRLESEDTAWAVFWKLGASKKIGDWSAQVKYAEIEAGSVYGELNDGDFGGADTEGFVFRLGYRARKNMSWATTFFSVDHMLLDEKIYDRLQVDCMLNF